jgi:transposase InsO family protein
MSNKSIVRTQVSTLSSDGLNYLPWSQEIKLFMLSKGIAAFIQDGTAVPTTAPLIQKRAECLLTIIQHLDDGLRSQYLNFETPAELWNSISTRFGDRVRIVGPQAISNWSAIRFMDFKNVSDYSRTLFNVSQQLESCGKHAICTDVEKIHKTLSTFPAESCVLSAQYANMNFQTFNDLQTHLIIAENSQTLLMKNSKSKPAETHYGEKDDTASKGTNKNKPKHYKKNFTKKPYDKKKIDPSKKRKCFSCGNLSHVAAECRTPVHLQILYKEWLAKENAKESHHVEIDSDSLESPVDDQPPEPDFNGLFPKRLAFIDESEHDETFASFYADQSITNDNPLSSICDSGTTHTIVNDSRHFTKLIKEKLSIRTIGSTSNAKGHGPAILSLPNGTVLHVKDAIYMPASKRNLISFADIKSCGFNISTGQVNGSDVLKIIDRNNETRETFSTLSNGLYFTTLSEPRTQPSNFSTALTVEPNTAFNQWHARLGHPSHNILRKMVGNLRDFTLTSKQIEKSPVCPPCIQGKFQTAPSKPTTVFKQPAFLERIHMDICGPINPPCGPFRYFQVVTDSAGKFEITSLLSSKNQAFARLLTTIIKLKNQFPEYPIKEIRSDNAAEYTSEVFEKYCESTGISISHSTPHIHTQNGIAEAAIKKLQLICRPMLLASELPASCWGHAILHASYLLKLRPSAYHDHSPHQLMTGFQPSVKHLRTFGCGVYIPIPPPVRSKMGIQRQLGVYIGCISPAIIRYLDLESGEMFTAKFADCVFDESLFPILGNSSKANAPFSFEKVTRNDKVFSFEPLLMNGSNLDAPTAARNTDITDILSLQLMAKALPDGFNDAHGVVKKQGLLAAAQNAAARVPVVDPPASLQPGRNKRGRPLGSTNRPKKVASALHSTLDVDSNVERNDFSFKSNGAVDVVSSVKNSCDSPALVCSLDGRFINHNPIHLLDPGLTSNGCDETLNSESESIDSETGLSVVQPVTIGI